MPAADTAQSEYARLRRALVNRHTCPACRAVFGTREQGRCPACRIDLFVGRVERRVMGRTGFYWDEGAGRWAPVP
jgi:hypothetical protein